MSTTVKAKFERGVKCILVSQIWIPKAQPHSPLMWVLLWSIWTKSLLDRSHLSSSTTTRLLFQSSHGPFLCRIQSKLLGVWKQMNSPDAIPCVSPPLGLWPHWHSSWAWVPPSSHDIGFSSPSGGKKSHVPAYRKCFLGTQVYPFRFPQSSVVPQYPPGTGSRNPIRYQGSRMLIILIKSGLLLASNP